MKKKINKIEGYRFRDLEHLKINLERESNLKVCLVEFEPDEEELRHDFTIHGEFNDDDNKYPFNIWYLKDRNGLMYITETCV